MNQIASSHIEIPILESRLKLKRIYSISVFKFYPFSPHSIKLNTAPYIQRSQLHKAVFNNSAQVN